MKLAFLFFIFLLTLSFNTGKSDPDKIVVLISQVPWERPVGNSIEDFWLDRKHFDTIQITGKTIVGEINKTLKNLSIEKEVSEISYECCIIRFSKGQPIDTFYSWRWFDYWRKGTTMYYDSTKRLEDLFLKAYHVQWGK